MLPYRDIHVVLIPTLLAALSACDTPSSPALAPAAITELPRSLSPVEVATIRSANAFGFDLLRRLHADPENEKANTFISPLSASMSLGMALNGANGETYDAMVDVLGLQGLSQDEINTSYSNVMDLLLDLDPSVEFGLANSIWLEDRYPFRADYRSRVEEVFDARIENVHFRDPATAGEINVWVEGETSGRIEKMVAPEELQTTIALLLNALYFKGSWTNRFDPSDTEMTEFRRPDGTTVVTPMMVLRAVGKTLRWDYDPEYSAVDLPYGGDAFSMTVVVPNDGVTIDQLVERADAEWWATLVDGLEPGRGDVWLPRFELTYEAQLGNALKAMGMEIAFTPGQADFTRMVEVFGPYIGWVKQKSFIHVDEEGTEAAAATATAIVVSLPPTVRADRPFLFAIRERLTGTILFIGTVTDPTA